MDDPDFERAVERDLIGLGLRLRWLCDGSDRLNWRDLLTIVYTARPDTFLGRFELGDAAEWGIADHLLAGIFDTLQVANFQRGGAKGRRPEPIERPGDKKRHSDVNGVDDMPMGANESGVFRGEPTPLNELMDWLGWSQSQDEKIVAAYAAVEGTYAELGERFGVSASTVGRIVRNSRA